MGQYFKLGRDRRIQPTPAADVHLYLLDEEGLLFCQSQQKIFALNTAAAFIWIGLEDSMSFDDLVLAMGGQLGLEQESAANLLVAIIDDWCRLGVLVTPGESIAPLPCGERYQQLSADPNKLQGADWFVTQRCYRLLDSLIRVRWCSAELEKRVHPVIAHLQSAADADADADITLDILDQVDGIALFVNGEERCRGLGIDEVAPSVKGYLRTTVALLHPHVVNLHAGVVGNDHSCMLLPASSGSGKSTLTAALLRAGYSYLSDETALLEMPVMGVRPFPLAICAKSAGWPVLEALFPEARRMQVHSRGDGKRVRYYFPADQRLADPGKLYPVDKIVFPIYDGERRASTLEPISRIQALSRLLNDCILIPRWLDPETVAALVRWIGGIGCFELKHRGHPEGVALIASLYQRS